MEIYTEDDVEYYTKIAPYGRKDTLNEVKKWKNKFKKEKLPWTYGTSFDGQSTDELYALCIEIHREYGKLKKEKEENANDKKEKQKSH